MKELSIKEKAKRYDEAIEKLRDFYRDYDTVSLLINVKEELANIFPELKESEDDGICRKLIAFLKQCKAVYGDGFKQFDLNIDDAIAWIEKQGDKDKLIKELGEYKVKYIQEVLSQQLGKQGEQKPNVNDTAKEMFIKALERVEEQNTKGYKLTDCDKNSWWEDFKAYCGFSEIQKPTDKVEPKFKVGDFIQFKGMGHTRYTVKEVCGLSHYINTCNKRMDMSYTDANFELIEQKPAEWSEDDQSSYNEICNLIYDNYRAEDASRLITWLNDIKDRVQPQPKQEWSREDEIFLNTTIAYLKNAKEFKKTAENCINWLKSLRPNHWKPSEEQMVALNNAILLNEDHYNGAVLSTLREQLKKLREE